MRVARKSRYEVPVYMRRHIAEARQIYFVRIEYGAQRGLDREDDAHAMRALRRWQVGHFPDMCIPDDAAIARVVRIAYQHDAAMPAAPEYAAGGAAAERACACCGDG